jgi:hypothetical protein
LYARRTRSRPLAGRGEEMNLRIVVTVLLLIVPVFAQHQDEDKIFQQMETTTVHVVGEDGRDWALIDQKAHKITLENGHTYEEIIFGLLDYQNQMARYQYERDKYLMDILHGKADKPKQSTKAKKP